MFLFHLWLARSGQAWELAHLTSSLLALLLMDQDSHYPKTEKPHTLIVTFSWLKSSSLGLLRHGHFKKQASKDTGKNHFLSASTSFCFKMTFCIQQHELSFELSEFSLTQSSLAGGGVQTAQGGTCLLQGHQEKLPYLVLIVEKQPWKYLDVFYFWWSFGSGAASSMSVRKSSLLHRWQCHQAWYNAPLNALVFPFVWEVLKSCPRWQPFGEWQSAAMGVPQHCGIFALWAFFRADVEGHISCFIAQKGT